MSNPMINVFPQWSGLYSLRSRPIQDDRGQFSRLFCDQELAALIGNRVIRQVNESVTHAVGAIRGLHFQYPPHAEMKIIRCMAGKVFDVVVDLRKNSPTFLNWHAEILTPDSHEALVVPEGFAHGFQVLEPSSRMLYFHTERYHPDFEGGIRFDDARIGICWPATPADLSSRDREHPLLDSNFEGIEF